jgi:hypothetical protein
MDFIIETCNDMGAKGSVSNVCKNTFEISHIFRVICG